MYLHKWLLFIVCFVSTVAKAQLTGGIESNAAWYIDDNKIKLASNESNDRVRSNTYFRLDYRKKNFTAGLQAEAYYPKALLNYSPKLQGTGVPSFYVRYANDSIGFDITLGNFYEQFGSGLVLRAWEDRQLGINNAIVGGRLAYKGYKPLSLTLLYGKQRDGLAFDFSDGKIAAANAQLDLAVIFKSQKWQYGIGGSWVNRNESIQAYPSLPANTFASSIRGNLAKGGFSIDAEYAFKQASSLVEFGTLKPEFQFDGDAYLVNIAYSQTRFGINASLRRLENFALYSQQNLLGNAYSQGLMNYVPSLTKQFDYSLTNIYVYMAQPRISFNGNASKAGEIGGQVDLFYKIKKETALGGKYGTQISINYAQWHGLSGRNDASQRKYEANFLQPGEKFYHEASIEIRKKWSSRLSSSFTYLNQYYNASFVEESFGEVNANTIVIDNTISLPKNKSLRIDLQHQWANALNGNWAGFTSEFNFSSKWAAFATDLYNYGNKDGDRQLHYYNFGFSYKPNSFRLQLSYGRQRGGLQCVGGICRFVPENAGLNASVNYSF